MSTQSLFTILSLSMSDGEQFQINVTKRGDALDLVLIPKLSLGENEVPDDAKGLRAALAAPLAIKGVSPEGIEEVMAERFGRFCSARGKAKDALDDLVDTINDETANAKNKSAKKKAETTVAEKDSDTEIPKSSEKIEDKVTDNAAELTKPKDVEPQKSGNSVMDFV